jgi:ElaB/YqjD/DUF883 family membrane-anchored ribosome-binding protein
MVESRKGELFMAENETALPDGTDKIVAGAAAGDSGRDTDIVTSDTVLVTEREIPAPRGDAERPVTGSGSPDGGLADRIRGAGEKFTGQAGERARGLVSQGLERSSEALANVARMVGDTAPGIEERLGPEYGGYARRAASAIENAANALAEKNADELIDDTREFVRNSPGIALAGAAVVGFVVARLVKTATARDDDDED